MLVWFWVVLGGKCHSSVSLRVLFICWHAFCTLHTRRALHGVLMLPTRPLAFSPQQLMNGGGRQREVGGRDISRDYVSYSLERERGASAAWQGCCVLCKERVQRIAWALATEVEFAQYTASSLVVSSARGRTTAVSCEICPKSRHTYTQDDVRCVS